MTEALLFELSKALIFALAGGIATWVVMTWRRDRADAARDNALVEAEFAPTLARVRPVIEVANHQPPPRLAGTPGRHGVLARALLAAAGAADLIGLSATRPTPVRPRRDFPALDRNTPTWPVNPPVVDVPAVQVGRVHMPVDFETWVRGRNAELHEWATDPAATGFIPRITADVAQ